MLVEKPSEIRMEKFIHWNKQFQQEIILAKEITFLLLKKQNLIQLVKN